MALGLGLGVRVWGNMLGFGMARLLQGEGGRLGQGGCACCVAERQGGVSRGTVGWGRGAEAGTWRGGTGQAGCAQAPAG
jgi:hypothetical protein